MLIRSRRGWSCRSRRPLRKMSLLNRRALLKAAIAAPAIAAVGSILTGPAFGQTDIAADDPTAKLYPVQRNPRYTIDRTITDPSQANTYTNFYEFGSQKNIWRAAQNLKLRPWTVKIAGMVEQEKTVDIDSLLAQMPLEERTYRHRCVEAWSMAVPGAASP